MGCSLMPPGKAGKPVPSQLGVSYCPCPASLPLTASPTPIAAWDFLTQDSVV